MMNSKLGAATALAAVFAVLGVAQPALADPAIETAAAPAENTEPPAPPPAFKFGVTEVVDFLRNTRGGIAVGNGIDNKFAVAATLDGGGFGHPGFKAHVQIFNSNEGTFSAEKAGDIQIASNIEAPRSTRLFAAWAEQAWGDKGVVRVGLMDVNIDFDHIDPAGLFLNSSHGIGIDIAQTGPSIYPVSALGVRGIWSPIEQLTIKAAVFDGVSGDPDHPHDFVRVRLHGDDGALLLSEADWKVTKETQISLGVWGQTATFDRVDPLLPPKKGQVGVYGSIQGPLPFGPGWTGWLRVGVADSSVDEVGHYIGLGVVKAEPLPGRKDDQAGIAVARAGIGGPARRLLDLPDAETSVEATYSFAATSHLSIQPDVQYIIHPASESHLANAFVVGVRVALAFSTPAGTSDDED